MIVESIKKGEHSCRNCNNFNHKYSCWINVEGQGENCTAFKEKHQIGKE